MSRKLTNGERYTFQKILGATAVISDSTDGAEKNNNYIRSSTLIISSSTDSATLRISVGDNTTNDPQIRFNVSTDYYTLGIDNSQNNDFAISQTQGLPGAASANTVLRIPNNTGDVHVRNNLIVTSSAYISSSLTVRDDTILSGSLTYNVTRPPIIVISPTYTIDSNSDRQDHTIYVNASLANATINLPGAVRNGRELTIIKIDATANTVQLSRSGSDTINGAITKTANGQYESITLISDATNNIWYIKSEYPAGSWI